MLGMFVRQGHEAEPGQEEDSQEKQTRGDLPHPLSQRGGTQTPCHIEESASHE